MLEVNKIHALISRIDAHENIVRDDHLTYRITKVGQSCVKNKIIPFFPGATAPLKYKDLNRAMARESIY